MTNYYHQYDLPKDVQFEGDLAVDTEAMGLQTYRDRLCVVQISDGKGDAHLVHFPEPKFDAPNLKALLNDETRVKLFHYARFDLAIVQHYLGLMMQPVYCTKIASRLCRTFTDRHSFKELCRELIQQDISKQQQSSDWGAATLTDDQIAYAASDVLYLHQLREELNRRLVREGRMELAADLFACLPARVKADLAGWAEIDIFAHT
ncbi:MAG: ribonuclease D [Rickettsiales bacterium]|nr:ribonuclease D [Rickettsiales bacterium]|tara:strand:+ start:1053 stop:1667 length:615 start_codon:yes stop_codon:yes gene_type:complete